MRLPAGEFTVTCGRGPEYVPETCPVTIDRSAASASLDFRLRRWIDPAAQGWYSGDHHIHAAGCSTRVVADGSLRDVAFDVPMDRSSWIALRILGSAHTNPIFVMVGDRSIRASRRSADWCLKAVDQCWSQKSRRLNGVDRDAAQGAYEHARARYREILSECEID